MKFVLFGGGDRGGEYKIMGAFSGKIYLQEEGWWYKLKWINVVLKGACNSLKTRRLQMDL